MAEQQNEDGVVQLVDAGVPADQGLSSLGLLMQLAGNVLAAYAGMIAFSMLFAVRGSGQTLWFFLIFGACIARSLVQRWAGAQLLYGNGGLEEGKVQRMAGIHKYVVVALAQTAVVAGLLYFKLHMPGKFVLALAAGLSLWPVTLAILVRLPRFKRFSDDLPLTEDKGFEGASILMTVLGTCGLVATGTLLLILLDLPGNMLTKGPGVLVVLSLGMLVVRSVLHVQAGLSGLRETSVDRSVELANRYANFGVISSFCFGGALLLAVMSLKMNILGLVAISAACWLLMAWPLIIRRFFSDRQFADLLAGDGAPLHRRAPDAGLTGLGWLLFSHAIFSASLLVIELFSGEGSNLRAEQMLSALGGGSGFRSVWWSVGSVVLQAWAGYELIRMSPQSRVIATIFGIVGAAVTIYINLPFIEALKSMRSFFGNSDALQLAPIAMGLIIPVATLVLVNRKIAPTARARFRKQPAPQPPTS